MKPASVRWPVHKGHLGMQHAGSPLFLAPSWHGALLDSADWEDLSSVHVCRV